jgi:3-hydroxy-9,10-secoandrosta-1,3,5(10)-triene-9,17-dione monooxygenase
MPGRVIPKPPSRGEILDRARAMVPTLRSHALQAERDRLIPRRTHEQFRDAGFYGCFSPRATAVMRCRSG